MPVLAEGGGSHCSFINTQMCSQTHTPRHVHTVTPFSILQQNGEWEMTERERKRKSKREGEIGWAQVSHYPLGPFRGYSYKII